MKTMLSALALVLAGAGAALAEPIEGLWQTEPDEGAFAHVRIESCGPDFCGTIVRTYRDGGEYDSPTKGRRIVRNMAPQGDGRYRGRVWRPSNDKVYLGKIEIEGDVMRLRGCVAGGLICAGQTWRRVR